MAQTAQQKALTKEYALAALENVGDPIRLIDLAITFYNLTEQQQLDLLKNFAASQVQKLTNEKSAISARDTELDALIALYQAASTNP